MSHGQYEDGSLHNVLAFELLVMSTALLAILGYCRASVLFQQENEMGGAASRMTGTEEEERPFANSSHREEQF